MPEEETMLQGSAQPTVNPAARQAFKWQADGVSHSSSVQAARDRMKPVLAGWWFGHHGYWASSVIVGIRCFGAAQVKDACGQSGAPEQ